MINLEQVKLLETKVENAVEYIQRLTREKESLLQREAELQAKLDSCQKRIDEFEVLITRFREDQGKIEDSILAALDRLNQFEEAMEKSLKEKSAAHSGILAAGTKAAARESAKTPKARAATEQASFPAALPTAVPAAETAEAPPEGQPAEAQETDGTGAKICFEIPESETGDDIPDPLDDSLDDGPFSDESAPGDSEEKGGELDIF